jgi:hypothetical protein
LRKRPGRGAELQRCLSSAPVWLSPRHFRLIRRCPLNGLACRQLARATPRGRTFSLPSNLVAPTCAIARRGLLKRAASACLDRLPDDQGAVAQLGERVNGIHEVRGSIPLGSTNEINTLSESFGDLRLLG